MDPHKHKAWVNDLLPCGIIQDCSSNFQFPQGGSWDVQRDLSRDSTPKNATSKLDLSHFLSCVVELGGSKKFLRVILETSQEYKSKSAS